MRQLGRRAKELRLPASPDRAGPRRRRLTDPALSTCSFPNHTPSTARRNSVPTITHWVNNEIFAGASSATSPVTNPATGAVTGEVALANVDDARAVIDVAAAAYPAWRDTSLAKRTQILFAFRELLNARKEELAAIITSEHGKVLSDALGEVSQEVVEFACGIPHLLKGGFTENASTNVDVYSVRQPLGPVGIISPFNFPAMV